MEIVLFVIGKLRQTNHNGVNVRSVLLYAYWNLVALFICYIYFSFRSLLINADRDQLLSSTSHFLYQLIVNPSLFEGGGGSYLGSSQLIRKAENPFSFLRGQEKVLSMLYLHFRYMYLLVLPVEQSPEYSFNCIPSVKNLGDVHNLYWMGAYGTVFVLGCCGIYHATNQRVNVKTWSSACSVSTAQSTAPAVAPPSLPVRVSALVLGANGEHLSSSSVPHEHFTVVGSDEGAAAGDEDERKSPDVAEHNYFDFSSTAILDGLIWLVVPFVPASGVFFKLGTLLAERLLYMTSIGYCILAATLCYAGITFLITSVSGVFVFRDKPSVVWWNSVVIKILYWIVVLTVTCLFYLRTVEYNTVWLNNESLFTRSLSVCPNSAKMHVQVSKVFSGKQQFTTARMHVQRAKEIDPDFCDIGYQEALLSISLDNSAEDALDHALGNLKCVYSNSGSMQLVNQLWAMELNAHSGPNRQMGLFKTIAKQAAQAVKAGLDLLGAKKFLEASSAAYEAKQYKKAISLTGHAERVLLQVEATNRNVSTSPDEIVPVPVELRCRIFLVAGTHRAFYSDFLKANKAKKIVVDKTVRKELGRAKELLFKAIEPDCVRAGAANGAAGNGQLHIALNYLAGIINGEVDQSRVESVEEYAFLLSTSYLMLHLQQQLSSTAVTAVHPVSKENESALVSASQTSPPEPTAESPFGDLDTIRGNAARMWNTVGAWHQKARQMDEAAESFEKALQLFAVLPASADGAVVERHAVTPALMRRHLPTMVLTNVSCNSLYWYSDVLAGQEDFQRNAKTIRVVIRALKTYLRCPVHQEDGTQANRAAIEQMIDKMERYLAPPLEGQTPAVTSKKNKPSGEL